MFAAYRSLSEATGVELSVQCTLAKGREFLVTSCGTCVRLYEVQKDTTLRSISVHDLYGRVSGIHAIPLVGGVDVLVLIFDLRVSVVEYDVARCAFRTLEIHDFSSSTTRRLDASPKTCMDPQKRCIAIMTSDSVIVMPVVSQSTVLKPFTVTFRDAGLEEFGFVRDVVFLDGYAAPTLLFLQEDAKQTWCGNLFTRQNTCRITGVSVDFQRQRLHVVWHVVNRLPHDSLWLREVRFFFFLI